MRRKRNPETIDPSSIISELGDPFKRISGQLSVPCAASSEPQMHVYKSKLNSPENVNCCNLDYIEDRLDEIITLLTPEDTDRVRTSVTPLRTAVIRKSKACR